MRGFNSTIKIKSKACIDCSKVGPIFSHGRCSQCAKIYSINKQDEKESELEGESLQYLFADLDTLFSLIVRMSAADEHGIAKCYTCGVEGRWQTMDCGHYESRKSAFLRWDLRNGRIQCQICNRHKGGKHAEFGKKLEDEKPGITEILLEESRIVHKWSREELRGMIIEFNRQLAILKNKFKN